jgi:Na+-transporting NADH:ubiquinone oxidoreductase subunit C
MFSNRYIFIYSSVMVIVVAILLSLAASMLKPYQEKNIKAEKIQYILAAAGIETTRAQAEEMFNLYIIEERVIDRDGQVLSIYRNGKLETGEVRAFQIDLKVELKKLEDHEKDPAKPSPVFPLYVFAKDTDTLFIVPMRGRGLWGPIYGNIAFRKDMNTISGAHFAHDKETPGLGAEIAMPFFYDQFIGKTIFDANGKFQSVKVVKGGVKNANIDPMHGVDAISGGTITSNGVSDMVMDCLENYVVYFKNNQR